jgi:CRP/FNR family transcriptional regulator
MPAGETLIHGGQECIGLVIVKNGQLRAFMTSEDGREMSLYRLLPRDVCIMTAACMLKNVNFDIFLQAEKPCDLITIPTNVYEKLDAENPYVKSFSLDLVSSRFSYVMWVVEKLVFTSFGKRLASILLEQSALAGSKTVELTHDQLARDLGSAREVVTRGLKQFQLEGMVRLLRGKIILLDLEKLRRFSI